MSSKASITLTEVPNASMPSTIHVCPRPEKNPFTAAIKSIGNAANDRH